jgi:transposase InsO family protein
VFDLVLGVLALTRATCRRRSDLVVENLLLRHQLAVLTRPTRRRRVHFRRFDTLLWVLVRRVRRDWRRHLVVVTPDTVIRWHRAGWRLYWRWRSRSAGGRPRLAPEVRQLIARMSQENPLWGSERIRGELLKLGIAVSNRSIRRYRWRGPRRPRSQTWRTFLRNHAHAIWASDLFTVQTLTFKTLYVVLFIAHGRRELIHFGVTAHPTAAWVWRQLVEATPWGRRPRHLIRDRDRVYGADFRDRAKALGIETVLTPVRAPRVNAVAERVIGTLRRECLVWWGRAVGEDHPRECWGCRRPRSRRGGPPARACPEQWRGLGGSDDRMHKAGGTGAVGGSPVARLARAGGGTHDREH